MGIYLKLFNTTAEYNAYTADTANFILPNVSVCEDALATVYYNPLRCEETSVYDIIGTPSYPSEVDGADTSFDMTFNYKRTDINEKCKETITEGSDTVTVEIGTNPSTASSRTVEGTYDYHGLEIAYSVTQTKFEAKVTAKFNVTSTSSPTRIASGTTGFSKIEIDGVEQPSVTTGYTFSTLGEHTVKYTLTDPTSIGMSVFYYCRGLTSIYIPDSVTSIGNYAFGECSGLTSCTIGSGVTSIGMGAFSACTSLTSIDIPNSVTSIGGNAFQACSSLTSIDIPNSVTSIGNSAFGSCSGLTSCTIGSGVTSMGNYTFYICTSLTSVDIPNSVTSIGSSAFKWCTSLTSCTIGSSVTSIGESAFSICSSLTSITSNAITAPTIESSTFQDVKTSGTLTVPSGSSGYGVWMGTSNYYLGKYNWTKVEQ